MSDDLMLSSTSDTPEQIEEALRHGIDANSDGPVLSTIDEDGGVEKTQEPGEEKDERPRDPTTGKFIKAEQLDEETQIKDDQKKEEKKEEKKVEAKAEKKEEKPRRNEAERRIAKLTWERENEKRERLKLEQELADLKAGKTTETKAEPKGEPEPKAEDFETHEAWLKALAKWSAGDAVKQAVADALKAKTEEDEAEIEEDAATEAKRVFTERKVEAQARYADFDDVMLDNQDMPINGATQYAIMRPDNPYGHDMAYILANDPERAKELAEMQGPDLLIALGELKAEAKAYVKSLTVGKSAGEVETTTKAEPKPDVKAEKKVKPVTKAEDPIEPVGTRTTATSKPDDQLSYREYKAKRDREEMNRRRMRR